MRENLTFRSAAAHEAENLSALAIRSKAYWGYSQEFMRQCVDELTVSPACINSSGFHLTVATAQDEIVAFFVLENQREHCIELGALFVDPGFIGQGVGRATMDEAIHRAKAFGARLLVIHSDPNAAAFYSAAGGVLVSEVPSGSIAGRMLPCFHLDLVD